MSGGRGSIQAGEEASQSFLGAATNNGQGPPSKDEPWFQLFNWLCSVNAINTTVMAKGIAYKNVFMDTK
jgi:hypothetical protein